MAVFIKKNNNFDNLKSTSFPLEIDLSNLIIHNPEVFPIYNYSEEGTKWIPVSVEMRLETGELDIFGIDYVGGLYIIESKLFQNHEKKTVRQQVIDYCFALRKLKERKNGWNEFCDKIATANKSKEAKLYNFHNKTLEEIVKNSVPPDHLENCLNGIKNNFEKGNYTLVVAMDRIPNNLRISIDGHNEMEVEHRVPTFALIINEFQTLSDEKIVVTSTYPYDLAEIKRKKSRIRGEENDEVSFKKHLNKSNLSDEQRKIFDEFAEEIKKLATDVTYGTATTPSLLPHFDTVAGGDRSPLGLGSDGNLRFKLDALYEYVKNAGTGQNTKESDSWQKKIKTIPELERFYNKRGWNSYLKPEEWMPVYKELIKILKELILENHN